MDWTRKQMNPGTEFRTAAGRVIVKMIDDPRRPGAPARPWWGVTVNGQWYGAAHKTAKAAMDWAEQPGVTRAIKAMLG